MIYITGDIHGDVARFSADNLLQQGIVLTAEDTVINVYCLKFLKVIHS